MFYIGQILLRVAINAQSKEKQTFIGQNKAIPMDADPHGFYRQNTKKHSSPKYLGTRDSGTFFYPEIAPDLR